MNVISTRDPASMVGQNVSLKGAEDIALVVPHNVLRKPSKKKVFRKIGLPAENQKEEDAELEDKENETVQACTKLQCA
jgi:hypothetical protein